MMEKIFSNEAEFFLSSPAFIFAQVNLFPQEIHLFSNTDTIASCPSCASRRSLSQKQRQVLKQIEAKVGGQG